MKKYAGAFFLIALSLVFFPRTSSAQDMSYVVQRLERIQATQEEILKQLAEIKQELQIVKVRATAG